MKTVSVIGLGNRGTETLTAAPSSPRCICHRRHFGDDVNYRFVSDSSIRVSVCMIILLGVCFL